jgi:hypothetical protein
MSQYLKIEMQDEEIPAATKATTNTKARQLWYCLN